MLGVMVVTIASLVEWVPVVGGPFPDELPPGVRAPLFLGRYPQSMKVPTEIICGAAMWPKK